MAMTITERVNDGRQRRDVKRKKKRFKIWPVRYASIQRWVSRDASHRTRLVSNAQISIELPNKNRSSQVHFPSLQMFDRAGWQVFYGRRSGTPRRRLRAIRMIEWWLTKPAKMSSMIFSNAISVECSLLHADWTASNVNDADACVTNRINTNISNILLIVFISEMGR